MFIIKQLVYCSNSNKITCYSARIMFEQMFVMRTDLL